MEDKQREERLKRLREDYKFANRCATLIKTPQYKELKRMAKNGIEKYKDTILKPVEPLEHDKYIMNIGRYQGLSRFFFQIESMAKLKENYAEQLKQYQ